MAVILTPIPAPPPSGDTVCDAQPLDLLDATCDWRVYDGFEQVTFWRRLPIPAATTINNALFKFTEDREAQISFGVYTRHTGTYYLPKEQAPNKILVGDWIEDNLGNYWVVVAVDSADVIGTQWQLEVNSLRFNLPLTNSINYYSVVVGKDAYGGRVLNKELIESNIICCIQPIDSEDEIKNKRIYHNTTHFIYIEGDIESRIGDIVEDEDANYYEILGVEHRSRIDEFNRLIVKEIINDDEIA